jgi:hypothetical protein
MVMRRLYDELRVHVPVLPARRHQASRRQSDDLGHHRHTGDLTIPMLRNAIGRGARAAA